MSMFKYPLSVTVDTNIFDAAKFDLSENSTIRLLENYVKDGKIQVVLSDIVIRESKKHISDQIKRVCGIIRQSRTDILKVSTENLIKYVGLNEILNVVRNKDALAAKGEQIFDNFVSAINAEILGAELIDVNSILEDYFRTIPPFENSEKKKNEFPDAFIAQQIKKRFGNDETVAIISKDKGFIKACGQAENHIFFDSLGSLYDAINKESAAYNETISVIKDIQLQISSSILKYIKENENIEVQGLSVDSSGLVSGYDYADYWLHSVSNISFVIHSVDEISENDSIVTLICKANISADCYYDDYDNSPWDPEEKEYVYIETIKIREEHTPHFGCRIKINRKTKSSNVFPFTIILGGDSRTNLYVVDKISDENEDEINAMDRESLGFQPLGSYASYLEDNLSDSEFSAEVVGRFEKMNDLYRRYEDCSTIYDLFLSDLDSKEIIKAVYENIFDISDIPHIDDIENLTSSEIESIKNWANIQYERTSEIAEISFLPNSLDFGKTVIMKGVNGSEAYFSIDSNQVNPSEGDEEIINVQFSTGYGMPKNGYIKLTVGYLKFDEDGGASEGISDEIEYVYDSVLKELDAFIDEQTYLTEKDTQISESINNAISNVHKQI